MGLVLLALIPAGAAGVHFLGTRSLAVIVVSVIACAASEAIWQTCAGQPVTARDLSAVVTGLLLAYNLPPSIPLWMAAVGGVFSMIIVKQFFGGIGQNIVNPALAGRAMMLICWPVQMTSWTVQGVSGATSLAIIKGAESAAADITGLPSLADAFLGRMGGCIGETSALALIAGGVFLMAAGVISWRIPAVYIATVAALSVVLGRSGGPVLEILSGGLMLGAFFMATDYTTSPITPKGQLIFAFGCGLVTSLIRAFGGYPEGVSYSILIMNLVVPLIDRATKPKILGEAKAR
jgi:electron transport complex protein RnfD